MERIKDFFRENEWVYSFLFLSAIGGCIYLNKSDSKPKKEITETEKQKSVNEIMQRAGIKYVFDSLDYDYSIEYKDAINSTAQLICNFDITDIAEHDSSIVVCVSTNDFYFNLAATNNQVQYLLSKKNNSMLVVKIDKISKVKVRVDISDSGEFDEPDFRIEMSESQMFFGKGKILSIVDSHTLETETDN